MFQWDEVNLRRIARHRLSRTEIEAALRDGYAVELQRTVEDDEERLYTICATPLGRIIVVVTTERGDQIRVVTAYPAAREERRYYQRGGR